MIDDQLPPDPHVQLSFINRGESWSSILKELLDNSFDDAAGNAVNVIIQIKDGSVSVWDDGKGIADINALGRLGSSGSYQTEGNIGQYGVGAKTWLCKAHKLDVATVHDGLFHKHIFNAIPIIEALKHKRTPPWLNKYKGTGKPTSRASFTMVTLREFRRDLGSSIINVQGLITELEKTYWPGLISGRRILIEDTRKRSKSQGQHTVRPLAPPNWSDKIDFDSSVNGKRYKARIGILSESVGAYSGIWFGFLFRNICIEKSLTNRAVPTRIHGQIELSGDWRHSLANYKDAIIEDREALLLDIEQQAASILDLADEYAEDILLDKISLEIEGKVSLALMKTLAARKRHEPGSGGGVKPEPDPDNPVPEIKSKPDNATGREAPKEQPIASGIRLKWEHLGNSDLFLVREYDRTVTITLNRDCPKLSAQRALPRYPGIYLAMGFAIAFHCLELTPSDIRRLYSGMIGETADFESKEKMMRAILAWWGFVAEELEKAA